MCWGTDENAVVPMGHENSAPALSEPQDRSTEPGHQFSGIHETYQKACLDAHNKYRALHNVPPLKTSAKLQASAIAYAEDLIRRDAFEHSNAPGVGENLAYVGTFDSEINDPQSNL